MVHRYSPPARRSTRAVITCQRRSRSGSVIRAKVSSALSGTRTDFSTGIQASSSWEGGRVADELIEFACPERVELGAERGHPPSVQTVVLKLPRSPAGDETDVGEYAQVMGDRRPAHGEVAGQLGHRLLTGP